MVAGSTYRHLAIFKRRPKINPTRESFASNGVMTELSRDTSGKGRSGCQPPANPGSGWIIHGHQSHDWKDGGDRHFPSTTLEVKTFDDGLFITKAVGDPDTQLTRWVRVDPYRYFVVLAAGKGLRFWRCRLRHVDQDRRGPYTNRCAWRISCSHSPAAVPRIWRDLRRYS